MLEIKTGSATLKIWDISKETPFQLAHDRRTLTWQQSFNLEGQILNVNSIMESDEPIQIVKLWTKQDLIERFSK